MKERKQSQKELSEGTSLMQTKSRKIAVLKLTQSKPKLHKDYSTKILNKSASRTSHNAVTYKSKNNNIEL